MATLKKLSTLSDGAYINDNALPAITAVNARLLAAATAETMTIPAGAKFVIIKATSDVFVQYNGTATVPGDTTDGTSAELNPGPRSLDGVTSISVIASGTPIVTATFYS
jgi:hypothetical protein